MAATGFAAVDIDVAVVLERAVGIEKVGVAVGIDRVKATVHIALVAAAHTVLADEATESGTAPEKPAQTALVAAAAVAMVVG